MLAATALESGMHVVPAMSAIPTHNRRGGTSLPQGLIIPPTPLQLQVQARVQIPSVKRICRLQPLGRAGGIDAPDLYYPSMGSSTAPELGAVAG